MAMRAFWMVLPLLASACAFFPPQVPAVDPAIVRTAADFAFSGRFSFRYEERHYYGRMSWHRTSASDSILFSSSFGQGAAKMTVDPQGARLVLADGAVHEARNAEALTDKILGYPLSPSRLSAWILGEEGNDRDIDRDSLGRIVRLRHEGWIVDSFYDNEAPGALPARINAIRAEGNAELRLKIDDWTKARSQPRVSP